MQRTATPDGPLRPPQLRALDALVAGATVTAAAKEARVDRATVHRWLREDFEFQAAFNGRRQEVVDAMRVRLIQAADSAARCVQSAIEGGDVRAALVVLKGLGLLPGDRPTFGADDAEGLREPRRIAEEEARRWRELLPSL